MNDKEKLMRDATKQVLERFDYRFQCFLMGTFKGPKDYLLAYVFKTDQDLEEARSSGFLDEVIEAHRQAVISAGYPSKGIMAPRFTSEEPVKKTYNGYYHEFFIHE